VAGEDEALVLGHILVPELCGLTVKRRRTVHASATILSILCTPSFGSAILLFPLLPSNRRETATQNPQRGKEIGTHTFGSPNKLCRLSNTELIL
jgi:hypothetical protein